MIGKTISINNIAYWRESKESEALAGKCKLFRSVSSKWVWDTTKGTFCNLYSHLCLGTVFTAFKLTHNCYLYYDINIFS